MVFSWSDTTYDSYEKSKVDAKSVDTDIFHEGDIAMLMFATVISSVYRLFEFQKQLVALTCILAIPTLYFNIWSKYRRQILARYGLTEQELYSMVSACASRRDGKSTFFQLLAAALVLCSPPRRNSEYSFGIGIVSINLEASKKMIRDIEKIIHMIPDKPEGIKIQKTATKIIVTFPNGLQNIIYGLQTGEVRFSSFFSFGSAHIREEGIYISILMDDVATPVSKMA